MISSFTVASLHVLTWLVAVTVAAEVLDSSLDYGMVMDVGSTGTQLFIYAWSRRELIITDDGVNEPESMPYQVDSTSKQRPGIQDSTPQTYSGIVSYLQPLIEEAKNMTFSLKSRWNTFPIYFKATAGMRILNEERRIEILSWARTALSNSSFNPFLFDNDHAVIISGEEESLFGWLTVNYFNNKLLTDSTDSDNYQLSQTLGSLDLGGQSTQITFAALPSSDILESFTNVRLWNNNYRLYTHSFLKYGTNAITDRIGQLSYEETLKSYGINSGDAEIEFINDLGSVNIDLNTSGIELIKNPCYNPGYNKTFTVSSVYNENEEYTVREYGDSVESLNDCRRYFNQLFYNDTDCLTDSCNINGVYQKSIHYANMTFYAFSAFGYAVNNFGLPENEKYNLSYIYNVSQSVCNLSYIELNNSIWGHKMYDLGKEEYLNDRCLVWTYMVSLLHDAYRFPMENTNIVFTTATADGSSSYGWTQGSILRDADWLDYTLKDETIIKSDNNNNKLTSEGKIYQILTFAFVGVLLLTCIVLIYVVTKMIPKHVKLVNDTNEA